MASYRTADFERALVRKGYVLQQTHHNMYWFYLDGKKTLIKTRTSNGEREFNDQLFAQRREQIGGLSKEQMLNFIDCCFTHEMYKEHLIQAGKVIPDPPPSAP